MNALSSNETAHMEGAVKSANIHQIRAGTLEI